MKKEYKKENNALPMLNLYFAQPKHNNNFRRFSLKGLEKVELEFGLMALGHNLRMKVAV